MSLDPKPPMTRGERQVWATAYAAFMAAGHDAAMAATRARQAVDGLRRLADGVAADRQIRLDAMEMIRGRKMPT